METKEEQPSAEKAAETQETDQTKSEETVEEDKETLKVTDSVYEFARKIGHPTIVLPLLKSLYSIQSIRPFLYKVRSFLDANNSVPDSWNVPEELVNIGGLSQQKALRFLENNNLWDAYIVFQIYGDKEKGFSRQIRKTLLEWVGSSAPEESASDEEESKEPVKGDEVEHTFPWKEVDDEQRKHILHHEKRKLRRNKRQPKKIAPMYYIQVDPKTHYPFFDFFPSKTTPTPFPLHDLNEE